MLVFIGYLDLIEYSQMNTCLPEGFNHFSGLLNHFVMAKLATSSIKFNDLQATLITLCTGAVVKIDSSPPVPFYQKFEWANKVFVYLPRKSTKYSDRINLVSITSSFTFSLH